jgi:adenosylmethionine-8-amino-7-oxononanoate aminotransferase
MEEISVLSSRSAYADRQGTYNPISHGCGPYLFDRSGRRFFDASGGSGSIILGHGDRQISALLAEQATKLTVFPGRYMSCELVERYAHRLTNFATSSINRDIIYSSGSDAVKASIKLAIQYHRAGKSPNKTTIIGRHASYVRTL